MGRGSSNAGDPKYSNGRPKLLAGSNIEKGLLPVKTPPIRITLIEGLDTLWPRKNEWNALVSKDQMGTIFQTFEWHYSWWKTFGNDFKLLLLLAEKGDELIGIAPLMVDEIQILGCRQKIVKFIGTGKSDYCDFIMDRSQPAALSGILQWLFDNRKRWDVIHLSEISNASSLLKALPDFYTKCGYLTSIHELHEAPTIILGDPSFEQGLLKKKSLRRHCNFFSRTGHLELKNYKDTEKILLQLDLFFEQHVRRRASTHTPSKFLNGRNRDFCREIVRTLAPEDWLLFSVLRFNGKPIAFHFGFEYEKRFVWYTPSFDVAYLKHSPGQVLIKYLLEYAIESKLIEFDFTIGGEAFKYRFANHVRTNYAVFVFRSSLLYKLTRFIIACKIYLKRSPKIVSLGERFIGMYKKSCGKTG